MKCAIVIDSSLGLTEKEAAARGWFLLPLIFTIEGKEYRDGIDNDAASFYAEMDVEYDMRTSATPPALITELFTKLSKSHDHVVVCGLSTELSSQTSNLQVFAREHTNIHVIASRGVGNYMVNVLETLSREIQNPGANIQLLVQAAERAIDEEYAVFMPETMKWLVKGGRISPAAASLARLFNIVPMLELSHGRLEKLGKGRRFMDTIMEAARHIQKVCAPDAPVAIYHGAHPEINKIKAEVEKILKKEIAVYYMPPVIAVHTGPGVIAIVSRRLRD